MAENQNLLTRNQVMSPEEILDDIFSGKSVVDKFSSEVMFQVSNLCNNNPEYTSKRVGYLMDTLDGRCENEEDIIKIVSNLYLYGVTGVNDFDGISLEGLFIEIKKGNYSFIETLLLSKMDYIFSLNDSENIKNTKNQTKAIFEISHLIKGIVEMFSEISANPQKKPYIMKALKDLEIFYLKFENKLKKSGNSLEEYGFPNMSNTHKEITANITYAQVMHCSEISFSGNDSKSIALKEFLKKREYFNKYEFLLIENKKINQLNQSDSIISQPHIDNYEKQALFLKARLNLEYNLFKQEAYFENTCKLDKVKFDITTLKSEHVMWLDCIFREYSQLIGEDLSLNNSDLTELRNKEFHDAKNNIEENIEDKSNRKGRIQVKKILDNFIVQLSNNNPDTILLFNIIELILYQVDYVDKEMVDKFQESINDALFSNKKFSHGDLNIFSVALTAAYKYKKMKIKYQKEALIDPGTGLSNKGAFDYDLSLIIEDCIRINNNDSYRGLLTMDIDHFKDVNDTYGHIFGDRVLSTLANVLKEGTRSATDSIYRTGGEEFFITFKCNNVGEARAFAEKIRKTVESKLIAKLISNNEDNKLDTKTLNPITVSIGFTEIKVEKQTEYTKYINVEIHGKKLSEQADKSLYIAKDLGRNVCVEYTDETNELYLGLQKNKQNQK